MNSILKDLLANKSGDYIFPFFWQHGEDEKTLRHMMKVIHEANCKSVCIESRPHPDFCGEKWWQDMDVILDEARKRDMKIWILDDSHFPTGFANGKVLDAPNELRRQSLLAGKKVYRGKEADIKIELNKMFPPKLKGPTFISRAASKYLNDKVTTFDDDEILSVLAVSESNEVIELPIEDNLIWHKPVGTWTIWVCGLSRNYGIHKKYMNMLDKESCRILIDEVYEKHYEHYKDDFGKTIVGFFSDEPELGNGFYATNLNMIGKDIDLPFSREMFVEMEKRLGNDWKKKIYLFWDNNAEKKEIAKARFEFMDAITKLVREDFSYQIGNWCREHGVLYIGHVIEDNNSHSRTGTSLGHYFRGLNGQDFAGIDDIGGQVYPQEEDVKKATFSGPRDGEFYHFMLGNLAASAASIEPLKKGNSMCEIFGNYGWSEGLRLEKYLADHFMVRGINHFVPHAFTGKEFPDPDCPPHFYAWGHNPQYRHFGYLIEYMNRICTLISNGHRDSKVAVLYNGESEWMGESMLSQKPIRKLMEKQIMCDCLPIDAFVEKDRYLTSYKNGLKVNNQDYKVLIIPTTQFITKEFYEELEQMNIPIYFIDKYPEAVIDKEDFVFDKYKIVSLDDLANVVDEIIQSSVKLVPANKDMRLLEYTNKNKIYYLFNEAASSYSGTITIDVNKHHYIYDAWNNKVFPLNSNVINLEASKSLIIIEDDVDVNLLSKDITNIGEKRELKTWERSICENINYPNFVDEKNISLPDNVAKEKKYFSGIIRYKTNINIDEVKDYVLEISDAYEGVEVFINGASVGIQIVPTFRFEVGDKLSVGTNEIIIEVATTLERYMNKNSKKLLRTLVMGGGKKAKDPTGINGKVYLYERL